jgi:hypothetical protein
MKTQNTRPILMAGAIALAVLALAIPLASVSGQISQNQVECESRSTHVKAVTSPDTHFITTIAQVPPHILEPLLSTTVTVGGGKPSCLIAHFSAVARVIDNYIVFQVSVDGVPMQGHNFGGGPLIPIPIVQETKFAADSAVDKMLAYNFFAEVQPGEHRVEVRVGAGSNIIAPMYPFIYGPTLTLEYVGR